MINFVRNLDCDFYIKISLYDILCHIKLSFVGQFVQPTSLVMRREKWGIQAIRKGPWNARSSNMMAHLKRFAFLAEVERIADTSKASMI